MKSSLAVPAVFDLLAAVAVLTLFLNENQDLQNVGTPFRPQAAAATPPPVSQCNTGSPKCCKNAGATGSGPISAVLKRLNVVLNDPTAIVGLDCTPLTIAQVVAGGAKGADSANTRKMQGC
ncbi:hypothetical protein BU17DRAFT_64336 [Hysterangium stoloniferum]|nr:hypothetical protein BU17DRAFT_64336 [Hysterangium stoloniferum]